MNRKELSQNHWKYYLMLEKRFVESIEFVELHEDNFDAFSNGYALLIQAIGAELDTVFKEFCGFNTTDRKTVADYAQYILTNTPDIKNQKISVQEYDIEIQPFMNWDITQPAQSLQWWGAFTDVKHNRYEQLKQAKQENVLNILGALYLIESFNRFLIISLDVLICRYSPLFRAFPALFISEEPHKSFYYPSCFRSQK